MPLSAATVNQELIRIARPLHADDDFGRLDALHSAGAFFVIRAKSNTKFRRRYSRDADKSAGVLCDKTIVLTGTTSKDDYPQPLRRVNTAPRKPAGRSISFRVGCESGPSLLPRRFPRVGFVWWPGFLERP